MVKLTLEVSGISIKVMESDKSHKTICEIEGVVYFIGHKAPGSLAFLGGKERVTIPLTEEHYSLEAFKKHIVALAEKRGKLFACPRVYKDPMKEATEYILLQ